MGCVGGRRERTNEPTKGDGRSGLVSARYCLIAPTRSGVPSPAPDSIHVIHLIFFFLPLARHRTTPRRIIKPAASERASELPCRTGRKDAAVKCGSSSGGRGGGAPSPPPPLGKHDRQEKRHKIASSLSQNSDAGDDGIETTTADARIDANNMSMPWMSRRRKIIAHSD